MSIQKENRILQTDKRIKNGDPFKELNPLEVAMNDTGKGSPFRLEKETNQIKTERKGGRDPKYQASQFLKKSQNMF